MRKNRNNIQIINWLLLPCGALGTLSLYFEEWFPWSTELFFKLSGVILPVFIFSPLKYFCGIVELRVTDKTIERVWMNIKTCTIDRESIVVSSCSIFGVYCMVFSNNDLSHTKATKILCAALKRKAIIFPYNFKIKQDFLEWFE